jgi:hypothetical protein
MIDKVTEIGVSIRKGDICWVHGPFKCGEYSGLGVAPLSLNGMLDSDEKCVADGG